MIEIDQPVVHQAQRTMGAETAAPVILCILEKFGKIKSPGAYMRHLNKIAENRMFSLEPMLNALGTG
jgi:replication initiation protein RepC